MESRLKTKFGIVLAIALSLGLSACGGDKTTSGFVASPSTGGSEPTVPGDVPSAFFVMASAPATVSFTTITHKFNSSVSTACAIPSSATTAQEINCLVNVREMDLHFWGLKLTANYPANMCAYLRKTPYWYYKAPPGKGPVTLEVEVDGDAGATTSCRADGVAGTVNADGTCSVAEGEFDIAGAFTCAYDHTLFDSTKLNCCTGDYSKVTRTITLAAGTTTATATGSYGGSIGNCVGGPGDALGFTKTPQGYYRSKVLNAVGVQDVMTLPDSDKRYSTVKTANFYGWTNYKAGTFPAAVPPAALEYDRDVNLTPFEAPNIPYTFECLDTAFEAKHKINVYVNEWDTNEDFTAYAAGSTTASPNSAPTDIEGVNCSTTSLPGGFCDDYWDWDRLISEGDIFPQE